MYLSGLMSILRAWKANATLDQSLFNLLQRTAHTEGRKTDQGCTDQPRRRRQWNCTDFYIICRSGKTIHSFIENECVDTGIQCTKWKNKVFILSECGAKTIFNDVNARLSGMGTNPDPISLSTIVTLFSVSPCSKNIPPTVYPGSVSLIWMLNTPTSQR